MAEILYEVAQTKLETAYAHLLATIGEDPLPEDFTGTSVAALAEALRARWEAVTESKKESI